MKKIIATWEMSYEGLVLAKEHIFKSIDELVEIAINEVENNPRNVSVGYGGLPNEVMEVVLDAAYMNGLTMKTGCVAGLKEFKNPFSIAKILSNEYQNSFLIGEGAAIYALSKSFKKENLLTDRAKKGFLEKKDSLSPYQGHDTVGMVGIDDDKVIVGTSTSGLFMKKQGRVGDSPLIGSGLYVDNDFGGAVATGLGEDLMKGVISYEIISLLKSGKSIQESCEIAVKTLNDRLIKRQGFVGDLSVVAMTKDGSIGAATNIDTFTFVVMDEEGVRKYKVSSINNASIIQEY